MESSGSLQYTGERFMPLIEKPESPGVIFHNERYELAALFCHGKSVLEIGCGAGYGAAILAKEAKLVDAFDNSKEAIGYCREYYPVGNVEFSVGDIHSYQLPHYYYDVVVAYEVLEHIPDGKPLMQLIKDALMEDGMALISTPSPATFGGGFDICMYTLESLKELLGRYFKNYVVLNHSPGTFSFNMKDVHTFIGVVWNDIH